MPTQPTRGCFGPLRDRVLRAVEDLSDDELAAFGVELASFLASRRDPRTLCPCCSLPYRVAEHATPSTTVQ